VGFGLVSPDPSESGHNDEFGRQIQMVLDANGDPAISYFYLLRFPREVAADESLEADDFSPTAIYFVSWNRAQYRWNEPVKAALVNDTRVAIPQFSVSLPAIDKQHVWLSVCSRCRPEPSGSGAFH
jgi:hypothetical protein